MAARWKASLDNGRIVIWFDGVKVGTTTEREAAEVLETANSAGHRLSSALLLVSQLDSELLALFGEVAIKAIEHEDQHGKIRSDMLAESGDVLAEWIAGQKKGSRRVRKKQEDAEEPNAKPPKGMTTQAITG